MITLETERLTLRPFVLSDAEFIVGLLNEPSFIQYIADKGVRTIAQAEAYLREGPMASYAAHGHGLCAVERKRDGQVMGMCGLIRRSPEQDLDLGYAFRPVFWGQGYALEAGRATLAHGRRALGLGRTLALVAPDNAASIGLLVKLGFTPVRGPEASAHGADTVVYELLPA